MQQRALAQVLQLVIEVPAQTALDVSGEAHTLGKQELVLLGHEPEQERAGNAVAHHVLHAGADASAARCVPTLDLAGTQHGLAAYLGVLAPEVAVCLQGAVESARRLVAPDGLQQQGLAVIGRQVILPGDVGKDR